MLPATLRAEDGVEDPMPTNPSLVKVTRGVSVVNASFNVPKTREPAEEEAYQCLRSAVALVSERTRFGVEEAEICNLPNGVAVAIPSLLFGMSVERKSAEVTAVPAAE